MLILRSVTIFLLCVLTFASSSYAQQYDQAVADRLDPLLTRLFDLNLSPGMTVAVVQGDRIVYARGFGYADISTKRKVTTGTQFYIASTTKSLTAFACALLAYEGSLDVAAPVNTYVPDLKLHEGLNADKMTLEKLLTHTHGMQGNGPVTIRTAYTGQYTKAQLLELTALHGPSESGEAFAYSNIGYNVAGFTLEAVTGKSWKDAVEDLVLDPLGMANTTAYVSRLAGNTVALPYRSTPDGFEETYPHKTDATMHAAGGHYTTSLDMAAWVGVLLNGGRWNGKQVFPAEVVQTVQTKHADQDRKFGNIQRFGWGLGWDIGSYNEDTLVHRFGSYAGFRSHVSFMPSRDVGVVVLVNDGQLGSMLADGAAFLIYDELKATDQAAESQQKLLGMFTEMAPKLRARLAADLKKRSERPQDLPYELTAYAGSYSNDAYGTFVCTPEEGKLVFSIGDLTSAAEVYNNEENQFRVELTGSGTVVTFTMQNGLAKQLQYMDVPFDRVD